MNRNDGLADNASEDPAWRVPAPSVDPKDVLHHVARARALQSRAMASYALAAWRSAWGGVAAAATTLARWHAARVTRRTLNDLSDHLLADIGITRGAIPEVVDGLLAGIDPRTASAEVLAHRAAASAAYAQAVSGPRDLAA